MLELFQLLKIIKYLDVKHIYILGFALLLFIIYSLFSTIKMLVKWSPFLVILYFVYKFYRKMVKPQKQKQKQKQTRGPRQRPRQRPRQKEQHRTSRNKTKQK